MAEVLDRLAVAVILVDPKQRIVHTNVAAEELLAEGRHEPFAGLDVGPHPGIGVGLLGLGEVDQHEPPDVHVHRGGLEVQEGRVEAAESLHARRVRPIGPDPDASSDSALG